MHSLCESALHADILVHLTHGHDDMFSDGDDIGTCNFGNEDLLLVGGIEV